MFDVPVDQSADFQHVVVVVRATATITCVLVCAPVAGCSARNTLSENAVQSAKDREAIDELRVYVSEKTIPVYTRTEQPGQLRRVISTRAAGLIVHEDVRDGAPRLWISFSPNCRAQDCAYGFVKSGDSYSLSDVPVRDDYGEASVYRRSVNERGALRPDANGVYPVILEIEQSG